jgi:hypothetical protein
LGDLLRTSARRRPNELGKPSAFLQSAKPWYDSGHIQSAADLKAFRQKSLGDLGASGVTKAPEATTAGDRPLGAQSDAAKLSGGASKKPIGEMARVPELAGKRDETFSDGQTTRFHIGRARFESFQLDPENADVVPHTSAHVANVHTMEFLNRVLGRPLDDQGLGAFRFGPEQLQEFERGH